MSELSSVKELMQLLKQLGYDAIEVNPPKSPRQSYQKEVEQ